MPKFSAEASLFCSGFGYYIHDRHDPAEPSVYLADWDDQNCLRGCLKNCGSVCVGAGKAECIAEGAEDNRQCRERCRRQGDPPAMPPTIPPPPPPPLPPSCVVCSDGSCCPPGSTCSLRDF